MRDIKKLIDSEQDKSRKDKTADELMQEILKADMELMIKYGRNNKPREFPDPVRPQWKN